MLAARWGTGLLAPSLDMVGSMALVGLPPELAEGHVRGQPATSADAKYVQVRRVGGGGQCAAGAGACVPCRCGFVHACVHATRVYRCAGDDG